VHAPELGATKEGRAGRMVRISSMAMPSAGRTKWLPRISGAVTRPLHLLGGGAGDP
jgi:hypothetical protein